MALEFDANALQALGRAVVVESHPGDNADSPVAEMNQMAGQLGRRRGIVEPHRRMPALCVVGIGIDEWRAILLEQVVELGPMPFADQDQAFGTALQKRTRLAQFGVEIVVEDRDQSRNPRLRQAGIRPRRPNGRRGHSPMSG